MADQNLLTLFLAVTAAAVLIQTGIVAGLCFMTMKITKQANRAAEQTRQMMTPVTQLVATLETASVEIVALSDTAKSTLHEIEITVDRVMDRFRRKAAA